MTETDDLLAQIRRLHAAITDVINYREHARGCEINQTDFCSCGLREAMERLDKTWREAALVGEPELTDGEIGKRLHETVTKVPTRAALVGEAGTPQHTECCGVPLAADQRFCPKCGWEARAAVVRGEDGWQPIATAPKDGTPFIAANRMDAFRAFYDTDADYCCWVVEDTHEMFGALRFPPTHWMSLPPQTENQK